MGSKKMAEFTVTIERGDEWTDKNRSNWIKDKVIRVVGPRNFIDQESFDLPFTTHVHDLVDFNFPQRSGQDIYQDIKVQVVEADIEDRQYSFFPFPKSLKFLSFQEAIPTTFSLLDVMPDQPKTKPLMSL